MAIKPIAILKQLFGAKAKPTADDFSDLIDSLRHKGEAIAVTDLDYNVEQADADTLQEAKDFAAAKDLDAIVDAVNQSMLYADQKFIQVTSSSLQGFATEATNPGAHAQGRWWFQKDGGTFTNFLDATSTPIEFDATDFGVIYDDGTNYVGSVVPLSLSAYALKADVIDDVVTGGTDKMLSAEQGKRLFGDIQYLKDGIGEGTVVSLVQEKFTDGQSSWYLTGSTFSGGGFAIGNPQQVNSLTIRVRARATQINSLSWCIKIFNKSGAVIATGVKSVSIAPGVAEYITIDLDETIENTSADQLYFMFGADQLCDTWIGTSQAHYPEPTYGKTTYATSGSVDFNNFAPSAVQYSIWIKLEYKAQEVYPSEDFIQKIIDSNQGIQGAIDSLVKTNDLILRVLPESTSTLIYSPGWILTSSTFNGVGSAIDVRQGFNGIAWTIRARSTAITSVKCWIKINDKDGAIVVEELLAVNIQPFESMQITWTFDTVENSSGDKLFFAFAANQLCDTWGGLVPYTVAGGYAQSVYYAGGAQTGSGTLSSFQYGAYLEIGVFKTATLLSEGAIDYIVGLIEEKLPTVELALASRYYAVEGKEANIYFDNIILADFGRSDLQFDVTCSKGKQEERRWTYTPVASDAGSTTLQIDVWYKGQIVASKSTTLITKAASAGAGQSIQIGVVGDSTLSSGQWINAIVNESMTNPNITFIGSLGTGAKKYEGRGGWTWELYTGPGRLHYRFDLSGVVTPPSIGSVYSHNGATYTTAEVNLSGGTGYVSFDRTGSNNPTATGVLTKLSGAGDATLNFSSWGTVPGNPYYDSTAADIDMAYYQTQLGVTLTASSLIAAALGINDMFGTATPEAKAAEIKLKIDKWIAKWRAATPNIRLGIGLLIPPAGSQDAFAANYANGQTRDKYLWNRAVYNKMVLDNYDTPAMLADGIYVIPFNCNLDTLNNYPMSTVAVNARNPTVQVSRLSNGVHPAQTGYDQMSDTFYAFVKSLF